MPQKTLEMWYYHRCKTIVADYCEVFYVESHSPVLKNVLYSQDSLKCLLGLVGINGEPCILKSAFEF